MMREMELPGRALLFSFTMHTHPLSTRTPGRASTLFLSEDALLLLTSYLTPLNAAHLLHAGDERSGIRTLRRPTQGSLLPMQETS